MSKFFNLGLPRSGTTSYSKALNLHGVFDLHFPFKYEVVDGNGPVHAVARGNIGRDSGGLLQYNLSSVSTTISFSINFLPNSPSPDYFKFELVNNTIGNMYIKAVTVVAAVADSTVNVVFAT